jgi:hypothetical protein
MQEEIHLLQHCIVGMGISIGSQVFQSYGDFVIWIKTNLPSGHFGFYLCVLYRLKHPPSLALLGHGTRGS